jgi:hypothetical protein
MICYNQAHQGWPQSFAADKPSECLVILHRNLFGMLRTLRKLTVPDAERSRLDQE